MADSDALSTSAFFWPRPRLLSQGGAFQTLARPEPAIEQDFAKLKHLLRKAAARTVGAVPRARRLHIRGIRQLPQKFRLSNLMPSRFSPNCLRELL